MIGTEDQAEDFAAVLVDRAMRDGADNAQVHHAGTERFEIDFNARGVDLLRTTSDEATTIVLFRGGKRGSATVNSRDNATLDGALASARLAADAGIVDPANDVAAAPLLPPSRRGHETADRDAMVEAVLGCTRELAVDYPLIRTRNSLYSFNVRDVIFANSRGVRQRQRRAWYQFGAMFSAKDGPRVTSFNYSGGASYEPFERLLGVGTVERLLDETLKSFGARPVPEKFVGDVIITPDCLRHLTFTIAGALNGYALMAGTTPYKGRRGETIASPLFSLLNRPRSSDFPEGSDFDGFGIPTRDLDVIKDGVLSDFLIDFYISRKLGLDQTAGAWNFVIPGGDRSIADIVAGTRRGIILSRFSGGQPNNNLDFSGIAKNSFYIENGEPSHALSETMISGNFQELLKNITAVSRETVNFGDHAYPFLAASGVTISAK